MQRQLEQRLSEEVILPQFASLHFGRSLSTGPRVEGAAGRILTVPGPSSNFKFLSQFLANAATVTITTNTPPRTKRLEELPVPVRLVTLAASARDDSELLTQLSEFH